MNAPYCTVCLISGDLEYSGTCCPRCKEPCLFMELEYCSSCEGYHPDLTTYQSQQCFECRDDAEIGEELNLEVAADRIVRFLTEEKERRAVEGISEIMGGERSRDLREIGEIEVQRACAMWFYLIQKPTFDDLPKLVRMVKNRFLD